MILVACGCSANKQPDNFDRQSFSRVAESTMYKLMRTSPDEYMKSEPFKELEALCAGYSFSPDSKKAELMELLFIAGMKDPVWTNTQDKKSPSNSLYGVAVPFSRRQADFAYQMCLNSWRERHGKEFIPVKLQPDGFYKDENWNS